MVDLLGHEQICCATSCEFDEKRATKPKFVALLFATTFFNIGVSPKMGSVLIKILVLPLSKVPKLKMVST